MQTVAYRTQIDIWCLMPLVHFFFFKNYFHYYFSLGFVINFWFFKHVKVLPDTRTKATKKREEIDASATHNY